MINLEMHLAMQLGVSGDDSVVAIVKLMNLIKDRQKIPVIMNKCNITSVHKKGSKKELANYRGLFRIMDLRSILERLIYNDCYEIIDPQLSDGNVGARKGRGVRDNIFVINAICNSVVNGNCSPIKLQVMDVEKCFDKLWLESCINALYENGIQSDLLNLL